MGFQTVIMEEGATVCAAQVAGHDVAESSSQSGLDKQTSLGSLLLTWVIPKLPSSTQGGGLFSLQKVGFSAIAGAQHLVSVSAQGNGLLIDVKLVAWAYVFAAQDVHPAAQHT